MTSRTLVYFGHVPAEGAGSAIIVYRHLLRFAADGWDVRVVADWGQDHLLAACRQHNWPVKTLTHRKKWWPPFNPDQPLSRAIRGWLWAGEVRAWLGPLHDAAAFTYLSAFSDTLSIAAAGFARRYQVPLATIIHDDARDFVKSPDEGLRAHARRQWIVENSTKAWFASPGLAACFHLDPGISGVLPPIPEGTTPAPSASQLSTLDSRLPPPSPRPPPPTPFLNSRLSTLDSRLPPPSPPSPLLIYAGNYWPPQLPVLADLSRATRSAGARFLAVLKENPEHLAYLRANDVPWLPPFPKNTDALDHFRAHASAMVVSYARTSDDMPWTRTSFPSKLIEYCHLGLPLVIVAPDDTAIVRWARERNFPDVFSPQDLAGFAAYVTRLHDPAFRLDRMHLSRNFARTEFSPAIIHSALTASLAPRA